MAITFGTETRSSAVARRPRDASYLLVVSFNIPTAQFFITIVTAASDLLVNKILLNSKVLLSPIVSGGVRPTPRTITPLGHNPLVCCRSRVGWGQDPASWSDRVSLRSTGYCQFSTDIPAGFCPTMSYGSRKRGL